MTRGLILVAKEKGAPGKEAPFYDFIKIYEYLLVILIHDKFLCL